MCCLGSTIDLQLSSSVQPSLRQLDSAPDTGPASVAVVRWGRAALHQSRRVRIRARPRRPGWKPLFHVALSRASHGPPVEVVPLGMREDAGEALGVGWAFAREQLEAGVEGRGSEDSG